jgi:hypothetical protein
MELSHKKHNKKKVIYKITINNKIYIGSTVNLYFRIKEHLYSLNKNIHGNKYLQRAYNKYQDFNVDIIRTLPNVVTVKNIKIYEKHYIDLLKPHYNISLDPVSPSEEDRKRISDKIKLAYKEGRLINPWSLNGMYIDIYDYKGCLLYENILIKNSIDILKVSNRSVINNAIRCKKYFVKNHLVIPTGKNLIELINEVLKNKSKYYTIYKIDNKGNITIAFNPERFRDKLKETGYYYSKNKDCIFCYTGFIQYAQTIINNSCISEELSKKV